MALAVTIYDEKVNGDLNFYVQTFNLSEGTNSVFGSSEVHGNTNNSNGYSDSDPFVIYIGPGQSLVNVEFFVLNHSTTPGTIQNANWFLSSTTEDKKFNTPNNQNILSVVQASILDNSKPAIFETALPISGGRFLRIDEGFDTLVYSRLVDSYDNIWDYELRFTVSLISTSIPEPTTFILLGFGIVYLWNMRRKHTLPLRVRTRLIHDLISE